MEQYFIWEPNTLALDTGFLKVSWYGLTWSLSIIVGYLLAKTIFKKDNKDPELAVVFVQYIFFGAMIGARVFDVLYYHFADFLARPMLLFEVWNGGLSSHGAVLGVILSLYVFVKRNPTISFMWAIDITALVMPLLGGFVRIGNFINSELYGKPSTLPWAVIFPKSDFTLVPRHPVQIYEALWLFVCFAFFWWIYQTKTYKKTQFTALFLFLVLGGRFLIEFMKDSSVYFMGISNTQVLSLVAAIVGLTLLIKLKLDKKVV